MMNFRLSRGVAAAVTLVLAAMATTPSALAQTKERGKMPEKHDSNTLHKVGKAIQYPFRKAGENVSKTAHPAGKAIQYPVRKTAENASVTAHRATNKNSVVKVKKSHRRVKRVVKPNGSLGYVPKKK